MKKITIFLFFIISLPSSYAHEYTSCSNKHPLIKKACIRLHQIWYEGNNELYLPFYAWHNRYMYTQERMQTTFYNEKAFGGGFGKGFYDEKGNWHGLYAMAFLDSHKNVEPIVGYAFLKTAHLTNNTRIGLGYSLLVTMRPDLVDGYPFPGAAPLVNFSYKRASLFMAYVPGRTNIGNVAFIFAKWTF